MRSPDRNIDYLRAELAQYEAGRAKAEAHLADDDSEYRTRVLAGWDYVIAKLKALIAKQQHAANGSE